MNTVFNGRNRLKEKTNKFKNFVTTFGTNNAIFCAGETSVNWGAA